MQDFWVHWTSLSHSPFALFAILFLFSYGIYHRYFRFITPVAESGSLVMALGIAAIACLPQFNFSSFMLLVSALLLLIVWLFIAVRLLQINLRQELVLANWSQRFSVGTWVAATVIVVLFVDQVESTLHGFIVFLGMIAVIIYLGYWRIILAFTKTCIRKRCHVKVDGTLLLAVIATQAMVLLLGELFRDDLSLYIYQALILLGIFFYFCALILILRYFLVIRHATFVAVWPNANHIIYGALAITGVAMLRTDAFSISILTVLWWLCAFLLFIMMIIDIARLVIRLRLKGWRKGVFVYTTSQWARNFTVGMFYTFTFEYDNLSYSGNVLTEAIAHYGQYAVVLLLIIELMIAFTFVFTINRNQEEAGG